MDIFTLFNKNVSFGTPEFKFKIIVTVILVMFIFTRMHSGQETKGILVILLLAGLYYTSTIYITSQDTTSINENKLIDYKLNVLQDTIYKYIEKIHVEKKIAVNIDHKNHKLDSLYIDARIISFLYNVLPLYGYNDTNYVSLLNGTNNILKTRRDIEKYYNANGVHMNNIHQMFEIVVHLKVVCLGILHNFVYTVPKGKTMRKYLETSIIQYNNFVSENIDKIAYYSKQHIDQGGINATTKFVSYKETRAANEKDSFDFFI